MEKLSIAQLKYLKKLLGKATSKGADYMVAEGKKCVEEALINIPDYVHAVYATPQWNTPLNVCKSVLEKTTFVSPTTLTRISHQKTPHEVIAFISTAFPVPKRESKWIVALDNIQDPHNMGSILRTCDWFGVGHILCSKHTVYHFNPKVVQASMGSVFRVRVSYVDLNDVLTQEKKPKISSDLYGENLHETTIPEAGILVLGNESKGISKSIHALCSSQVFIPSAHSKTESLNVGVACGILLSHLCKT